MIFKDQMDGKTFTEKVEEIVSEKKLNYMEAIFHCASVHNISEDRLPSLISGPLKEKLRVVGEERNMLKKRRKLPI